MNFKDYLRERLQLVKQRNCNSECLVIRIGVPQGTIRQPILFVIYVNDIFGIKLQVDLIFTDDIVALYQDETRSKVQQKLQLFIKKMTGRFDNNILSVNVNKPVFLNFANYIVSIPDRSEIKVENQNLGRVRETKYLGIIIDQHLKWDNEIDKKINELNCTAFIKAKLSNISPGKNLTNCHVWSIL